MLSRDKRSSQTYHVIVESNMEGHMEVFSRVVKLQLPNYLKSLPIPSTFGGFMKLSGNEWVQLVPFVVSTSVVVYLVVSALLPSKQPKNPDEDWVNKSVQKDKDKVADVIDIEDLGEKTAFCRCWKSKKVCFETLDKVSYSSSFLGVVGRVGGGGGGGGAQSPR